MGFGTLTFTYGSTSIMVETVTSFSESFRKVCTTTPLVSLSAEDALSVETGSSKTYNISFSRVSGASGISNSAWIASIYTAMDRWQCRTDGFEMVYTPDSDNPYIGSRTENGYIKSFTINYSSDNNELITGSIEFHVGTMYVSNPRSGGIAKADFLIQMSNSSRTRWYPLLCDTETDDAVDCIDSYTLYGGLEQPFEYITLNIPKNRLTSVAADLVDDIVAGKNGLYVSAIGSATMTVTKCKLRNKTYTITAYSDAEKVRGYKLSSTDGGSRTPLGWIRLICMSGSQSNYGLSFVEGTSFHIAIQEDLSSENDMLYFPADTSVWYILQVCAMYLGARIFFADGCGYLVDYRTTTHNYVMGDPFSVYGVQDLYTTEEDDDLYACVTGNVSLGDEGTDTMINIQTIRCSSEYGTVQTDTEVTRSDQESITAFDGERDGTTLSIPYLAQTADPDEGESGEGSEEGGEGSEEETSSGYAQASTFADNLISYRREPQQSITFTLKEMSRSNGVRWVPTYAVSSFVSSIVDSVDDVEIDNISAITGEVAPHLLTLSNYERSYPEGQTTYTFGVMSNIDLASSTSQILSNQR